MPPVESAETLIAIGIVVAVVLFVGLLALAGVAAIVEQIIIRVRNYLRPYPQEE